jgi:hypothetical protein
MKKHTALAGIPILILLGVSSISLASDNEDNTITHRVYASRKGLRNTQKSSTRRKTSPSKAECKDVKDCIEQVGQINKASPQDSDLEKAKSYIGRGRPTMGFASDPSPYSSDSVIIESAQ